MTEVVRGGLRRGVNLSRDLNVVRSMLCGDQVKKFQAEGLARVRVLKQCRFKEDQESRCGLRSLREGEKLRGGERGRCGENWGWWRGNSSRAPNILVKSGCYFKCDRKPLKSFKQGSDTI